jgi:LysM repeat protein
MTSKKFGRVFVPVFIIAALVLSLFASPVMAQEQDPQTVGPAAEQQVPQEWLEVFEFENGRVYYVLAQGDTLQDVADRFGTTVDDIRDANTDIDEDVDENDDFEYNLYAGQPILIPEDAEAFEQYDLGDEGLFGGDDEEEETQAEEQQEGTFDVNFEAEADWEFETTDLEQLQAGEVYYIVETGDSLQGIADMFDTDVNELQTMNADWLDDQLYVGQPIQLSEQVFPVTGAAPVEEETPVATEEPDDEEETPVATPVVEETPEPTPQIPETGEQVGTTPAEEPFTEEELAAFTWQPGSVYYIVAEGDTWQDILDRTGVTSDELQQANADVDGDQLFVGQPIQLPQGTVPVTGQPGIPATGVDFSVTPDDVNNRIFMFQEPRGTITNGMYIVESGDFLIDLAARMGVTLEELLDANPQIGNPNMLFRGEAIHIPGNVDDDFRDDPLAPAPADADVGAFPVDRFPQFAQQQQIPQTGQQQQTTEDDEDTDEQDQDLGNTPAEQEYATEELDAYEWMEGNFYYIVAQGDTLQSIAQQFNLTVEELQDVNGDMDADDLRIGQPIQLPEDMLFETSAQPQAQTTDQDDDEQAQATDEDEQVPVTGPAFGPDFNATAADIEGRNFMFLAPVGTITDGKYIATAGDNLSNLAQRMHVSLVDLLNANPQIENPNVLFRGEAVNIPGNAADSFYDDPLAPAFGVDVGPVPMDRVPFTQQQQENDQ